MAADRYLLAVDIGTTFTAAAVREPGGEPRVFPLGGSSALSAPSAVARSGDGLLFGRAAIRRGTTTPDVVATEFKRRMGDETPIILSGTPYGAEALTGALLGWVVERVEEEMGGPPGTLVLAHPANWGPYKADLLREASRLAGFPEPVLVPEPVAAAAHYTRSERIEVGEKVAVYDLGGGTFDTAVVQRTDTGFDILGEPHGMDRFGGVDLDFAVLTHVRRTIGDSLDAVDPSDPDVRAGLQRLGEEARLAKEALSEDTEVSIPVALPSLHTRVRVTREEFEDAIRPRIRDTVEAMRRAIDSAGLTADDISRVLLVGGASRVPLVADTVRTGLGRPVALDANPKHSVCLGAAWIGEPSGTAAAGTPGEPTHRVGRRLSTRSRLVAGAVVGAAMMIASVGWALSSARAGNVSGQVAATTTTTAADPPSSSAAEPGNTMIPMTTTTIAATTTVATATTTATATTAAATATTTATATTAAATATTTVTATTAAPATTLGTMTTVATTTTSPTVVPSLVGMTRTAAIDALTRLALGYQETRGCYGDYATDLVVFQSPEAGSSAGGGPVYFESQFLKGCSNTIVNSVIGLARDTAVASLEANGLVVAVNEGCLGGSTPGVVVSQAPAGGTTAPQGWTVTIGVQASGCG